jgi:N-formylglutamate amidohydrolase
MGVRIMARKKTQGTSPAGSSPPPIPTTKGYKYLAEDVNVIDVQTSAEPTFVVGLPHSGLYLPCDFPARFILHPDHETDIGAEDIFSLSRRGAVVIKSNIHRNALDLNRNKKTGRKKTIFNRSDRLGKKKYLDVPGLASKQHRKKRPFYAAMYNKYYKPFYERVEHELGCLHKRLGYALLISGHTFKTKKRGMPDICIGTGNNKNVGRQVSKLFQQKLSKGLGCTVKLDHPFKGHAGISGLYGKQHAQDYNALLVEVHQGLFMDGTDINKTKIRSIRNCIASAVKHVIPLL